MFVTSFSAKGYEQYGRHMLQSYIETEQQIPLLVYYEDEQMEKPRLPNIEWMPLRETPRFEDVENYLAHNKKSRGLIDTEEGEKYTYRYDAHRFFRKVFAVYDAYLNASRSTKFLAWVDADVQFVRQVPVSLPTLIFPHNVTLSYLGRANNYSETGFMGFNLMEEGPLRRFMMIYWGFYATSAFTQLREWHDCMVFDTSRMVTAVTAYSLSGSECTSLYPWDDTILSDWMVHHKGPERKKVAYAQAA